MYMQNAHTQVVWVFAVLASKGFEHLVWQDISKAHATFFCGAA